MSASRKENEEIIRIDFRWELNLEEEPSPTDEEKEASSIWHSEVFGANEFQFCLQYSDSVPNRPDSNGNQTSHIALHLKSIPNELGAIEINYTIHCDTGFHQIHRCVVMSFHENLDDRDIFQILRDHNIQSKSLISDVIEFDRDDIDHDSNTILQFECDIEIVTRYDLYGGIFSSMNKRIFTKHNEQDRLLNDGFIDDLFDFDPLKVNHIPMAIYEMVYQYYLMTMLNLGASTYGQFIWPFDNNSDIELFRNCKNGDVLTSMKFCH